MEKMDLHSPHLVNQNIERIAQLFPNCVTESAEGLKIDFDQLRQELSGDIVEGGKERYRLDWPGKREAIVTSNLPTTSTLRPARDESVDFDNTENIYIEGDNLEVLKVLQESYLNKIKMIYIDPPYNTGKDFVYRDNFAADVEEWRESEERDEEGSRLVVNPETAGRYHSDWLSMMYPRLKLARNLLTEDGVIFISIDDNEVHNLRKMCDEVFGEGNFVANFIWEKRTNRENRKAVSVRHDYLLCYARSLVNGEKPLAQLPMTEKALASYRNPDEDPRGNWKSDPATAQAGHGTKSQFYDLIAPNGKVHKLQSGRCWLYTKEVMQKAIDDNRIWFGSDGNGVPRIKTYFNAKERGLTPETILFATEVETTEISKNKIKKLFNGIEAFETPKPVKLIETLLRLSSDSGIILDFFSGSATTAHAIMKLNAEDNGNRKFIMVQIPELTPEKSEARNAGYKTIAEIGKERIRLAAAKIKAEQEKKQKTEPDSLFDQQDNDEELTDLDLGFRVYKLDSSNMKDVYYSPASFNQEQLDMFSDNIKDDRTDEDLVAQVMLDWGLPLSLKIEQKMIAGKKVYAVADDYLYCCFDDNLDEQFAREVATHKPLRIVFRDKGFVSDTAKENVRQLLKQLTPETQMRVI